MPFQAKVIIVLGAAVKAHGVPSNALRRRVEHAVALWKAGVAPRLLMSGGLGKHPPAEAELMKTLAMQLGVPEDAILIEPLGVSTLDSAKKCAALLKTINRIAPGQATTDNNRHKIAIVLVTDDFHMQRAVMAFRHFGLEATADGVSAQAQQLSPGRWLFYHFREGVALCWYRVLLFKTTFCHLLY